MKRRASRVDARNGYRQCCRAPVRSLGPADQRAAVWAERVAPAISVDRVSGLLSSGMFTLPAPAQGPEETAVFG
jgi:hypothetical protein